MKIKNKKVLYKKIEIDDIENEQYSIIDIKKEKEKYILSISIKKYLLPYLEIKINNKTVEYKTYDKPYHGYEQFEKYSPEEKIIKIELDNRDLPTINRKDNKFNYYFDLIYGELDNIV